MPRSKNIFAAFALIALCLSFTLTAHAQSTEVYVTANRGSDLNPCSRTSPCRTIQRALATTVVQQNGIVTILDSGDYSPFTISASASPATVTAVKVEAAPGVAANIIVPSGDGASITSGATNTVILRGLTFNGQTTGTSGIVYSTGGTLYVENCVIENFSFKGMFIGGGDKTYVTDTLVENTNGGIEVGLTSSTGVTNISLDRCRLLRNAFAGFNIFSQGQVTATISNTVASDNAVSNYDVQAIGSGSSVDATFENCIVTGSTGSGNGYGIFVRADSGDIAKARVSASTITKNNIGIAVNSSGTHTITSFGNNRLADNVTDGVFTTTIILK